MQHEPYPRRRARLALAIVFALALGLASRAVPSLFPAALGKYPGDALWTLMVFFGIAFLRPDIRPFRLALLALAFSWAVEFSQLYQAPWINSIRAARLGHLVLGSGFHRPDLIAYAIGAAAGLVLDVSFFYRGTPRETNTPSSGA